MPDRFRIDAKTAFKGHYKQPLENDTMGQWDLTDPRTGLAREPTVEIESIEIFVPPVERFRKLADGRKVPEKLNKYLVSFVGKRKRWVCGPANQQIIAALYGNNPQAWIGKRIKLWVDPNVSFGRKKLGGIRVRDDRPAEAPTEDPLDNAVDARIAALHDDAFGRNDEAPREPGEEG